MADGDADKSDSQADKSQDQDKGQDGKDKQIPFHEDPKVQEYIARQVESRVEKLKETLAPQQTKTEQVDEVVRELTAEFQLDDKKAQKLVSIVEKIVEKKSAPIVSDLDTQKRVLRFNAFRQANPDAVEYDKEIDETYKGLTDVEKMFVMSSPDGFSWILQKVKEKNGSRTVSDQDKLKGTSVASRSPLSAIKVGDDSSKIGELAKAGTAGNKADYQRIFSSLGKK